MQSFIFATQLKTEYRENPIGIGKKPRFSWEIGSENRAQTQLAYQLLVKNANGGIVWDSGKVYSSESVGVEYAGSPLQSRAVYSWQVCVWDKKDIAAWSKTAAFETGIEEQDWLGAEWIGAETKSAPYLRKNFVLAPKQVQKARLYVTGLGCFEAYINGKKVGEATALPIVTQYHKRYFYETHDVTELLNGAKNALSVMLGRGYYATLQSGMDWQADNWANAPWKDVQKLRLKLFVTYADGTEEEIFSDGSWKISESPLVFDEPYYGEAYDARAEIEGWNGSDFDDSAWKNARVVSAPLGKAEPIAVEGNFVKEILQPISVTSPKPGVWLYDMQKMCCGWCEIVVKGARSAQVKIQYSEKLKGDGTIDRVGLLQDHIFDGVLREGQTDYYTLKGNGEESWEPRFTHKGFRFIQVTADEGVEIVRLCAKSVHTDVACIGEFACSNERFNQIHEMCKRSLLNNYHGYPSDTPVYENMGYLADGYITQDTAAYNFDVARFYEKWATDIRLQVKPNGYLEQTAPMWDEDKENAPEWSLGMIFTPWQHYLFYGDKKLLIDNFEEMKKVFSYQLSLGKDYIFRSMWGDHGGELRTISPTAHMYYAATVLAEIAALLGEDKSYYIETAERIKRAFHAAFYDENSGFYAEKAGEFRLNAQILPLAFGMVPEKQKRALYALIEKKTAELDKLDSGILSLKYLFSLLTENGLGETALKMILDEQYHSFGYLLNKGATTLWEDWGEYARSYDHHMYGTVDEYFYRTLGGICRDGVGFSSVVIRPYLSPTLQWCRAAVDTVRGEVKSDWKKTENDFVFQVEIPANMTAKIYVPVWGAGHITESETPVEQVKEVTFIKEQDGYKVFAVGSGKYTFKEEL